MQKIRFRRSAKRELFELDDDAFPRVARAILELPENTRSRGYDKAAGRDDQPRIWAGRVYRVLYEVDERGDRIIIAVRRKDESTDKQTATFPFPRPRTVTLTSRSQAGC